MSNGIIVELSELIELRRYAYGVRYRPEKRAVRAGNHVSKLRGRGMDFTEVRNYQAGDEIRHMEWRVTARTGKPHVKLFQEERERPAILFVDFNPSMFFGTRIAFKSVIASRLASILAWTAVAKGDRLGGLLFSDTEHNEFFPRSRELGVLPFLAAMSRYTKKDGVRDEQQESKTHSINHALLRLRRVAKPGSVLVLISDFYNLDLESEQHLSRLRAQNDVLAYHICDPLELAPPRPQQYAITNGEQELLFDTRHKLIKDAYVHYCSERIMQLQALFKRMQIQYAQVTADMDLPKLVRQTYPRRNSSG